MDLTEKEIEELQEQIILTYKVIHQDRAFKSFYFEGIDVENQYKSESALISRLSRFENIEETLRSCIVELEEIKENMDLKKETYYEIVEKHDLGALKDKYGIKKPKDMDKLDIKNLLKRL